MDDYRSIELNLRVGCPIQCTYCPQSTFLNSDFGKSKVFDCKDLSKIIENASEGNIIDVFFAGFSEPLSLSNFFDFCDVCENNNYVNKFVLFTTGFKLNKDKIIKLSKYKKIKVNFHVENENMINFDKSFWNWIPLIGIYLPNALFLEVGKEINLFKKTNVLLDQFNLKHQFQKIINRAGNLEGMPYKQIEHAVFCEKMTDKKRPVILPDGTALACANDYGCEMKLGNLLEQKWSDLNFNLIESLQKKCDSGLPCFRGCHLAQKDITFKAFL